MSLVLSRKPGQSFRVGTEVFITVVQCGHGETRISIDAPKQVSIARSELEESSDYPDSGHAPRKAATSAKRTKRFARRRRGYRKSGTAVGFIRQFKAVMPRRLPPLELRRDALAIAILRRRGGDSDSAGAAVLA